MNNEYINHTLTINKILQRESKNEAEKIITNATMYIPVNCVKSGDVNVK